MLFSLDEQLFFVRNFIMIKKCFSYEGSSYGILSNRQKSNQLLKGDSL